MQQYSKEKWQEVNNTPVPLEKFIPLYAQMLEPPTEFRWGAVIEVGPDGYGVLKDWQMNELTEWRCHQCRRILAKMDLQPGSIIEIKCKCNAVNVMKVTPDKVITEAG